MSGFGRSARSLSRSRLAVALVLAILLLLTELGGEPAGSWLRYQREAVLAGDYWRILSAHLVHLGWGHLLLNLAGLALLWGLFAPLYPARRWVVLILVNAVAISMGFLLLNPTLDWYVGLSGVLHGILAAGALHWLVKRQPGGLWLAALVVSKLLWEQIIGPLPWSEGSAGGPVIVDAHLYGAIAGALTAAAFVGADQRAGRL